MPKAAYPHVTILGVPFFDGTIEASVDWMYAHPGLMIVPSAPTLRDIDKLRGYREAILGADFVIPDSFYMVVLWRLLKLESIQRISGLAFIREFLARPEARVPGKIFWVMAGEKSSKANLEWLRSQGIETPESHIYIAPMYQKRADSSFEDVELLEMLRRVRPEHVMLTVGGGTQEQLGWYLRQNLDYVPGLHCIGAAIAFLSGDQVGIPEWADKAYLGWFFRILSDPKRYGSRYWGSVDLAAMLAKWGRKLPPMQGSAQGDSQ